MSECGVCQQIIQKARVHYGGVSCYSCRAFFRRNTQREDIPPCKERGQCVITYTDRKLCTDCRYQKCLGSGMVPALVLNEDDKRLRFKKLHQKKKEDLIKFSSTLGVKNQMYYNVIDNENEDEPIKKDKREEKQAHDYTRAYLSIQQYREGYLQRMKDTVIEEPDQHSDHEEMVIKIEEPYETNSENTEDSSSNQEIPKLSVENKGKPVELLKDHLWKVGTNQRFRQLLELSHQAAIYDKLKDTDFPLLVQHCSPEKVIPKLDNDMETIHKEILTEDLEEEPVTSKHVYPETRKQEEEDLVDKYHHKKFRTSQEEDQMTVVAMLNRKRKSVIVQGPKLKKMCPPVNS